MNSASFTYQWQRCSSTTVSTCSDISGATSATYGLDDADAAKYIRAAVMYTDDYSTAETVYSAVTGAITNVNDAPSAGADQTGAVTEDASTTTATGTVASSDVDPSDTLTYTIGTAAGTYGTLSMSGAAWTYTIDNLSLIHI